MRNTTDKGPPLTDRMRAYAEKLEAEPGCGGEAAKLRELAEKLDVATKGYWSTPQTQTVQQFLGAYARAKLLWRDVTGEALV